MADLGVDANTAKKLAGRFLQWDEDPAPCEAWPTGSVLLDYLTGIGGIPRGRIVETYGPESSGKSTLALQTAAHVWHTLGIPSVYADFEDALDFRYAKALGLTPEALLVEQPRTLEEYLDGLKLLADKKARIALSICDSVAAAPSAADFKADEDNRAGAMNRARIWTQNLSVLTKPLAESGITLFLVNQTRVFIDASGGFVPPGMKALQPKLTTPGGKGIKFYSSLRVEFDVSTEVKEERINPLTREPEKVAIGKNVWLRVRKNKVAPPPWRAIRLQIRDGLGFDDGQNLLDFGLIHNLVRKEAQGRFVFPAEVYGFSEDFVVSPQAPFTGEQVAAATIRQSPELRAAIGAHIQAVLSTASEGVETSDADEEGADEA